MSWNFTRNEWMINWLFFFSISHHSQTMKIGGALPCTVLTLIALVLSNNGCLGSKYSIRLVYIYIIAENIYLAFNCFVWIRNKMRMLFMTFFLLITINRLEHEKVFPFLLNIYFSWTIRISAIVKKSEIIVAGMFIKLLNSTIVCVPFLKCYFTS